MNCSDSKATVRGENKNQERNAQEQAVLLKRCSCQVTLWLNKQPSRITYLSKPFEVYDENIR